MSDDIKNAARQAALLQMLRPKPQQANEYAASTAEDFYKAVDDFSKQSTLAKANITPYSVEDYKKFKTLLSGDKKSGYAVKPGSMTEKGLDELISVFSKAKGEGRGDDIVKHAVDVGGAKQLDAFDIKGKLPALYGKEFKETQRLKFDPQYAPQDWDYEKIGTPDVINMELDNALPKQLIRAARKGVKYVLPAAVLGAGLLSDSAGDAIMDALVPGGVESAGAGSDQFAPQEEAYRQATREAAQGEPINTQRFNALQKLVRK